MTGDKLQPRLKSKSIAGKEAGGTGLHTQLITLFGKAPAVCVASTCLLLHHPQSYRP